MSWGLPRHPGLPQNPLSGCAPTVPPPAARPRRQPHEALHLHAGAPAPPCGSSLQRHPGPRSRQPGRPPPPPPLPSPQGQEAEVPGEGARPVCRHGRRCVQGDPQGTVARVGRPRTHGDPLPCGTPCPCRLPWVWRPGRTPPPALPWDPLLAPGARSGVGSVSPSPPGVAVLTSPLPRPAPNSTAGPGPPPVDGPAGCRRERRQERGRSQERRQPSSSSSEKQRFYSCDRFGGREPPQPKPSLSSHPTSPTAGQEPGPLRQVRWPHDPTCLLLRGPWAGAPSCPGSQARACTSPGPASVHPAQRDPGPPTIQSLPSSLSFLTEVG